MKQDISKKTEAVDFGGFDSIVIVKHGADIPGGRTLDVAGFPLNVIKASHVVITDGKGVYKPFPVTQKMNEATIEQYAIRFIVTRDGGAAGGFAEKLSAARACGAETIVIRRPKDDGESMEEILHFVRKRL